MNVSEEFRAARNQLLELRKDYSKAKESFSWPEFTHFNFGTDWFDHLAADPQRGEEPALIITELDGSSTRRTWRELSARSTQLARWLSDQGVQRSDSIAVMLGNQVELWETMLAGIKLGAVLVPCTTQLTPADLEDRIERGHVSWMITNESEMHKFETVRGDYRLIQIGGAPDAGILSYEDSLTAEAEFELSEPTRADETLLRYFTSGTTSKAKLVEHTHTSYPVGHLSTMFWIGLEPGDVHLNVASPGWAKHAWSNLFTPWIAEATVFIYNYERFDAAALMGQMAKEQVTSFCAPPTVWRLLIQADLSLLQTPPIKLVSAGEPLNAEVIDQVQRAWGQVIRDGFGQTETTVQIANPPGERITIGAMGRPMPGYEVVLRDPATGAEGDLGEICLVTAPRPLGLMKGYFEDAEKTAEVFRDGVYHTGDIAERDEHGVLTYVGRADDVFKSSDYKLSPFELESVLIEHPGVGEAAVVPAPDDLRLTVPKAYIVPAAGYEPSPELAESILGFCREHLAAYKRIRRIEFADLPKTISGKIRRVELRRAEEDRHRTGVVAGTEFRDSDFPALRPRA
ncbi:AMP-dependent synthetase [Arthrobacter sp. MYb211]|uniref:AMP-binding protein n=1 Tax=unclassified Arthrobacter TaxID=235627 RepID=UPI000CFC591F|nr:MULTISPECIES: AMP-binding protein [unclassified Arthrobacter]PRA06901.1 AMP-dependent synthetase [Arthrobacter sp. MYb229]PRA14041.1 AMP-dependent synthetase [Arthrobacter sp. MYb221]PRB47849.1 AMP-dependent synthetase [Arthrobacter sp. MYb216]PRC06604.1 AMP-dependent synthetase [Arthrobacter sp. MYb211]